MVISRLRQCFIFSLTLLPIFYLSLCLQALSLSLSPFIVLHLRFMINEKF